MRFTSFTLLPIGCLALGLTSCATHLSAPSSAKLNAATTKVQDDVSKARNISRESRVFLKNAQDNTDKLVVQARDLQGKAAALLAAVPEALKPLALDVTKGVTEQQETIDALAKNLAGAQAKNDELEKHLAQTDTDAATMQREKQSYFEATQKVIDRANRDEKKLLWYRLHWWGSWIALGLGIIGCGIWALLKLGVMGARKAVV